MQDKLLQLIHSLSKSEKAYFRKQAVGYGQDRSYLRLFSCLDDMADYDETVLRRKLGVELQNVNLPRLKNYLYNAILHSLAAARRSRSHGLQLAELTEIVEVLKAKGLHEQSREQLAKALKKAEEHEQYAMLTELYRRELQQNLFTISLNSRMKQQLDDIIAHKNAALESLCAIHGILDLSASFHAILRSAPPLAADKVRSRLEQLRREALLQDDITEQGLTIKLERNKLLERIAEALDDYRHVYDLQTERLQLLEGYVKSGNADRYKEYANIYFNTWLLIVVSASQLDDEELQRKTLAEYRQVQFPPAKRDLARVQAMYVEMMFKLRRARYRQGIDMANEQSPMLKELQHDNALHTLTIWMVYFAVIGCLIMSEAYSEALSWREELFASESPELESTDIFMIISILTVIIHHALGNFTLARSLDASLQRRIQNHEMSFAEIDALLACLRQLRRYRDTAKCAGVLRECRTKLETIRSEELRHSSDFLLLDFVLLPWLDLQVRKLVDTRQ